jgi:CheY-like chemotaxis protein
MERLLSLSPDRHVPGPGTAGRRPVVLVVEDDLQTLAAVAEVLEQHGFVVLSAANSVRALKLMAQSPRLDVLVTDLDLVSAEDGFDVAKLARKAWPNLGVVYASGHLDRLPDSRRVPNARFLAKPYSASDLAGEVAMLMIARFARIPRVRPTGAG